MTTPAKRYFLIGCEVFLRELCAAVARSANQIDLRFLPKGLHDRGGKVMAGELQAVIDAVPEGYDAVLMGYALCNNGLVGLQARRVPLVAYRAHDCIACLLGSRQRYDEEFKKAPGTYWLSVGWVERGGAGGSGDGGVFTAGGGEPAPDDPMWLKLLKKYGEENARFLWNELKQQTSHYERLGYIDTGVGPQEAATAIAAQRAAGKGWRLERMAGSTEWIDALVDGRWDEDRFVVAPPGHRLVARYDGSLVGIEPAA